MNERVGIKPDKDTIRGFLANENPVFKYGIATLVVFGTLYVMQSYGVSLAWPVALVIGLGMLIYSDFWRKWL